MMNEKLAGGVVTTAVIAPFCLICLAGPAAVGALLGSLAGWLGGGGPALVFAAAVIGGLLVYRKQRRKQPRMAAPIAPAHADARCSVSAPRDGGAIARLHPREKG